MLDKNSLQYEQMQKLNDEKHIKQYQAQTNNEEKFTKHIQNKSNNPQTIGGNYLKQMKGDLHHEGLTSKFCKKSNPENKFIENDLMQFSQNYSNSFQDLNHQENIHSAYFHQDVFDKDSSRGINSMQNNKFIQINSQTRINAENKFNKNNIKNENDNILEHQNNHIKSNQIDGMNLHHQHLNKELNKGVNLQGYIDGNIETQGDEDYEEEEDTSSEFIKELLQNEQKLTQRIYCSEIKALKITKIFNDLIFSMKSELLAYLTLEDICHFKKALQYYLGSSVTKTIDTQILRLIWTQEQINNQLLWDTLINYSYLSQQYPHQYQRHSQNVNTKHDRSIRMDLDRTFPERDEFSIEQNQNKLFRVLNGLSYSIKEVGYIQGWNQITGLFILYPELPEDMVYWIINHLMHKISLKHIYLSIQNVNSTSPSESASEQQNYTPLSPFSYSLPNQQNLNQASQQNHHHNNKYASQKYKFDNKENYYQGGKKEPNHISCHSIDDKQSSIDSENVQKNNAEPNILVKLDFLTYALKIYLKLYMNSVYCQIEKSNYVIYIQKWFTVLFSQQLSPDITICFFAGIILQDWNYLIRMTLAVFDLFKEEIMQQNDPDDIMELFYSSFDFTKNIYNQMGYVIRLIQKPNFIFFILTVKY